MSIFHNVRPPAEALELMLRHVNPLGAGELVPTSEALDRVTAAPVMAPHPLPFFRRGTMDGFAVRSADTHGASASLPAMLSIVGEVLMGQSATVDLRPGEAAVIHTGGHLPEAADAVVPIEDTQPLGDAEVEVLKSVALGENVIQVGEDMAKGGQILPSGHWLRPQDIGALLAFGLAEIPVVTRPRVALLSTGDELVSPSQRKLQPGQIRDINSHTCAALTLRAGGSPDVLGIVADQWEALQHAAAAALALADVLVLSAGSSVSVRDMTARVIAGLGEPGILFHGVAVRPGKPTIGAAVNDKPVFGLPGNPVSAMNLFNLLVVPTIHHLLGCQNPPQPRQVQARVTRNVAAMPGREDHIAARIVSRDGELWAEPVFGKSNLIHTLVRADGTFVIPLDAGGVTAGDWVTVRYFR
jgi:molybdopterin molybdotransferase